MISFHLTEMRSLHRLFYDLRNLISVNSKKVQAVIVFVFFSWLSGRGMNAAFALGRLCDSKEGLNLLLKVNEKDRMVRKLGRGGNWGKMVEDVDIHQRHLYLWNLLKVKTTAVDGWELKKSGTAVEEGESKPNSKLFANEIH